MIKRLQRWVGLALLALVMAGCGGLAGEPAIVATLPPATNAPTQQPVSLPQTAPDLALGAQVYAANCTRCHGAAGKGDGEFVQSGQITGVPDFTNPQTAEGATPADWYEIITNGRMDKMMPPWADKLSDDERWSVANYVYSLSGIPAPASTEAAVVQAETPAGTPAPTSESTERAVQPPNATQEVGADNTNVTGVVSGTVTNQTAGSSIPADLALNLHVISSDSQSAQTFDTTVNPDGSYTFENVPMETGGQYIVSTSYEQAVYSSDVVTGDASKTQMDIPLSIYEVTDDPTDIQMSSMLMMLQPDTQPGTLQVVQIISFSNTSDRAYMRQVDGGAASVIVRLPAGATYEDFSGGSYLVSSDGTQVADTQPVLPGSDHIMHVAFSVAYPGDATVSISQPMDYALNGEVEVLAETGTMSVSGTGFSTLGTRQLGDRTFVSYGGALTRAAGDTLSYAISGATSAQAAGSVTTTGNGISIVAYVLIGAGLLAIGAAFGFFMRERTDSRHAVVLTPNALIKQIADLDVRYHEGKVEESQYRKQRDTLKTRLVALMKEQAGSDDELDSGTDQ